MYVNSPPPKKNNKKQQQTNKKQHKKHTQKNKNKNKLMFAIIQLKFGKTHLDRHQRHSDDMKCCSKCTLVCTSLIQPKRCKSSKRLETGGAPSGAAPPPPPTTPYPSYTLHLLARRERNCLADTNVIAQFQSKVQATGKRRGRLYGRLVRHASPQPPPFVGTVPKSLVCYPIVTFYTAVFFRSVVRAPDS